MLDEIKKKLNISKVSLLQDKTGSRLHYVTSLDETPSHIKYRYTGVYDNDFIIKQIGLEFVTLIDDEYVSFKELFIFDVVHADSYDNNVLEHVNLFLDLVHSGCKSLIVV